MSNSQRKYSNKRNVKQFEFNKTRFYCFLNVCHHSGISIKTVYELFDDAQSGRPIRFLMSVSLLRFTRC